MTWTAVLTLTMSTHQLQGIVMAVMLMVWRDCRCGMVYVDSRNLGYKPYFWRWLNSRTKQGEADTLQQLFDRIAVPAIEFVCEGMDGHDAVKKPLQRIPHTNLNMVAQLCRLLDATFIDHPKLEDPQVSM